MPTIFQEGCTESGESVPSVSIYRPAPVKWAKGELNVDEILDRVDIDITHVNWSDYLTLIGCGPTRFGVRWRLRR